MSIWKRIAVILLISIGCIGCDQSSKYLAAEHLQRNNFTSYLGDIFRIDYTENTGAFLGLGGNLPEGSRFLIFTIFVGIFLLGLFLYLLFFKQATVLSVAALALMFSGGFSNFIDRALNNGAVVDFLNIGVGGLRTGIFNVADVAILVGAMLFVYASYTQEENYRF